MMSSQEQLDLLSRLLLDSESKRMLLWPSQRTFLREGMLLVDIWGHVHMNSLDFLPNAQRY